MSYRILYLAIADALNEVAEGRGASSAQIALAWLRARRDRAVIVPSIDARRREQIEDSLGSVDVGARPPVAA